MEVGEIIALPGSTGLKIGEVNAPHFSSKEQLWLFREFGNFLLFGFEALTTFARPSVKLK